jgi:regulator of protease activity HflC (stomatin/prohibitin superfamily)
MSERDTHPTEPSSGVEQLAFDLVESTLPEQYRLDPETRRLGLYHVALIRRQIAERAAARAAAEEAERRAATAARLAQARRRRAA